MIAWEIIKNAANIATDAEAAIIANGPVPNEEDEILEPERSSSENQKSPKGNNVSASLAYRRSFFVRMVWQMTFHDTNILF